MRIHEVLEACIEYIAIDGVIGERQNASEELGSGRSRVRIPVLVCCFGWAGRVGGV
jgi:hypothetical protein